MFWILLAAISGIMFAISIIVDNATIDVRMRSVRPESVKAVNGVVYLTIAIASVVLLGIDRGANLFDCLIAFTAGLIASFSSVFYYKALKTCESSEAAIFNLISPLMFLAADIFILRRQISHFELTSFILLTVSPILTAFSHHEKRKRGKLNFAIFYLIHIVIYTVSKLLMTHTNSSLSTHTAFTFFTFGRAAFDLGASYLICNYIKDLKKVTKKHGKSVILITGLNTAGCLLADYLFYIASTSGVASLANAISAAAELVVTFILSVTLTLIFPKIGREDLSKKTIIPHLIATFLATIGIIFLYI